MIQYIMIALFASPLIASQASPHERLVLLFLRDWEQELGRDTTFAATMGRKEYNLVWDDVSLAAFETSQAASKAILAELQAIDPQALDEADQLNYQLFASQLKLRLDGFQYQWYLVPLNQRGGIQTADELTQRLDFNTSEDYEAWITKLGRFPVYMDQTIALMQGGIDKGRLLPKIVMQRVLAQIDAQLVEDPKQSGFYRPFLNIPDTVPNGAALAERGKTAVTDQILPAYRKFKDFYQNTYLPACPEAVGIANLPKGKEMYAYFVRQYTTTDLTPEQIHQIGLDEVARIRAEMQLIIKKVDFKGDFAAFLNFLRSDPRFYYKTPEALQTAYEALAKRIDPTLVAVFDKMPRMPYGVSPIPDALAPDTTTAYYQPPNPDGTKAGQFFVNLYKPETRPIYEMEALTLHEAVPGHHFQIALAQELGELPNFRRYSIINAFVEGWALYAESLGDELGLYADPYSKFGQLTYEMWRAVRLVVDTGIHYFGWERQRAIDYFTANAAKSENDIVNEIDRYIAWPGQALGYKIGELKIKQLRKQAEQELGPAFDVRKFHNVVLEQGAMPLDVLEQRIKAWIKANTPKAPN